MATIIGEITIRLVPGAGDTKSPVTVIRRASKMWCVEEEDGTIRGLFPSEIDLANRIQEHIVSSWRN